MRPPSRLRCPTFCAWLRPSRNRRPASTCRRLEHLVAEASQCATTHALAPKAYCWAETDASQASGGLAGLATFTEISSNPITASRSLAQGDPLRTTPDTILARLFSPWLLHSSFSDLGPPWCAPTFWFVVAALRSRCLPPPKVDFRGRADVSPLYLDRSLDKHAPRHSDFCILIEARHRSLPIPNPVQAPALPPSFLCHVLTCNPT